MTGPAIEDEGVRVAVAGLSAQLRGACDDVRAALTELWRVCAQPGFLHAAKVEGVGLADGPHVTVLGNREWMRLEFAHRECEAHLRALASVLADVLPADELEDLAAVYQREFLAEAGRWNGLFDVVDALDALTAGEPAAAERAEKLRVAFCGRLRDWDPVWSGLVAVLGA